MDDPYGVLGVAPDASWEEVCAARRRLAKELHPDVSGEARRADAGRRMALVNQAFEAVRAARASAPTLEATPTASAGSPVLTVDSLTANSFKVAAVPVVAFEALLLAAVELGDVVQVDEPHLLGVLVDHPGPCHCLFELAGGADGTVVSIDAAPRAFGDCPGVAAVRDAFVGEIRRQADQ